jgi:short-subunit dehydrogenase
MKLELDGRTCLVSGASAGIGAVIPVDGGMRYSAT